MRRTVTLKAVLASVEGDLVEGEHQRLVWSVSLFVNVALAHVHRLGDGKREASDVATVRLWQTDDVLLV